MMDRLGQFWLFLKGFSPFLYRINNSRQKQQQNKNKNSQRWEKNWRKNNKIRNKILNLCRKGRWLQNKRHFNVILKSEKFHDFVKRLTNWSLWMGFCDISWQHGCHYFLVCIPVNALLRARLVPLCTIL